MGLPHYLRVESIHQFTLLVDKSSDEVIAFVVCGDSKEHREAVANLVAARFNRGRKTPKK